MNPNNDSPVIAPPPNVIASEARQAMPSPTPEDAEISLLDLLQVIADNLRLLLLGPIVAGLIALGYSYTIPPTFTATTKFIAPQQQQSSAASMLQSLGALGGLAGAAGIKNPADQYIAFLRSRSMQEALIDRLKLLERYGVEYREDARKSLDGRIQIFSGKDGLITIDASDTEPTFAAQLANAHVEELGKLLSRLALTESQQRRLFFERQLANAKNNLIKSEKALKASGVSSSVLKVTPGVSVESMARLQAGVTVQEIKLGSMRGYLTESAPEFKQAQAELAAMRLQIARAEKEEPPASASDSDYIARFREFKYNETLFEMFAKQYEIARIDESREGAVIQVLDTAQAPAHKNQLPKRQIAMVTTLIAGFVLLFFVFVRHAMRSTARNEESAAKLVRLKAAVRNSLWRDR